MKTKRERERERDITEYKERITENKNFKLE